MFSKRRDVRRILFVDPAVQGTLIKRVVVYWLACLVTVSLFILCARILIGPARMPHTHLDAMWFHYGPALVGALLLLPLLVTDIIRVSNRFVGPLVRLRRGMRAIARGEEAQEIKFRENDFWKDFAEEYNAVVRRVHELESRLPVPQRESRFGGEADELPFPDEPVGAGTE